MADETMELTRLTLQSPFKKKQDAIWKFPATCACCGAETEQGCPERIMLDHGNTEALV